MWSGADRLPPLDSARAESLLAWLALHRGTRVPREQLAFTLWPDSSEQQARTNLRHVLHTLRRSLPDADAALEVTPRTLAWRSGDTTAVDVAAFEAALARAEEAGDHATAVGELRSAVELYRGELLAGSYDEWVLEHRERLRGLFLDALARLVGLLEEAGELTESVRHAERLVRADPLGEDAARTLMRLHAARGDAGRALRTYHATAAALERELGVAPAEATRAAYAALVSGPAAPAPAGKRVAGPPLVGRQAERGRLAAAWRDAAAGRAQLLLVSGEAGIGKTRLVEDLRAHCAHGGATVAEARCYGAEGALAYAAVVAWLRAEPLRAAVDRADATVRAELATLLPELGAPPPAAGAEEERRLRLFEAVTRTLMAARPPLLLVADDLQWADAASLQLLHYLLRAAPQAPLLVAATARREDLDDDHGLSALLVALAAEGRLEEVALKRLSAADTAALAARLQGGTLGPEAAAALHAETEGNPLFVVEALRAGGKGRGVGGAPSARVQGVITARLRQLSPEGRALAGLAAAAGRAFTADVLARATDGASVVPALDELWRRGLVVERGADGYDFSHGRIRDVAYAQLGPAWRRHHHRRLAAALAADAGDAGSAEVAEHWRLGGDWEQAAAWYQRAAAASLRRHAARDAVRLLDLALEAVASLPPGTARDRLEMDVLTAQGNALMPVDGIVGVHIDRVRERALAVAEASGLEPAAPLLRDLGLAAAGRGDYALADGYGRGLLRRAEAGDDDALHVEGAYLRGIAALWSGRIRDAREHLEDAVARCRDELRPVHLADYGQDAEIVCRSRLAFVLALLGEPAESARASAASLALAERVPHPYSRGVALVFTAHAALELGDHAALRARVARLAEERHVAHQAVALECFSALIEALDGATAAALATLHAAYDDAGGVDRAPSQRAGILRWILWVCEQSGDAVTGIAAADRLLALGDSARTWDAEALRVRAVLRAAQGAPAAEVAPALQRAIALARDQGAIACLHRAEADLQRVAGMRNAAGNALGTPARPG